MKRRALPLLTHRVTRRPSAERGSVSRHILVTAAITLVVAALLVFSTGKTFSETVHAPDASASTSAGVSHQLDHPPPEVHREFVAPPASSEHRIERDLETAADTGTLKVILLEGTKPAGGGRIQLQSKRRPVRLREEVDGATGTATFEGLVPEAYELTVEMSPLGFLAPRSHRGRGREDSRTIEVRPGVNVREIVLERSARVFGYLRDADGEVVDSNLIRCSVLSTDPARYVKALDFAVSNGYYEGDVYEGVWRIEVLSGILKTTGGQPDPWTSTPCPPIPRIETLEAGSVTRIDFAHEARGTASLDCIFRDEEAKPFGGLKIYVSRLLSVIEPRSQRAHSIRQGVGWQKFSDDQGRLVLPGLPAGTYKISVEMEGFHPLAAPGQSTVGAVVNPVEVEVPAGESVRVEMTVLRPHPVRVRGKIHVDPAWAKRHGVRDFYPEVHLVLGPRGTRLTDRRSDVSITDSEFDFYLEATENSALLEIHLGGETMTYPLTLSSTIEEGIHHIAFPR